MFLLEPPILHSDDVKISEEEVAPNSNRTLIVQASGVTVGHKMPRALSVIR